MNGPEHYRRAEALLDACQPPHSVDYDDQGRDVELYPALEDGVDSIGNSLKAAQVHATLALAAAVADGRSIDRNYEGQVVGVDPAPGWTEATA